MSPVCICISSGRHSGGNLLGLIAVKSDDIGKEWTILLAPHYNFLGVRKYIVGRFELTQGVGLSQNKGGQIK